MLKFFKSLCKNRSFSLLELIMTIVVVGIVTLPISITLGEHVRSVFVSQDYSKALNLARLGMENVLRVAYGNIADNVAYDGIAVGTSTDSSYSGYLITTVISYAYGTALTADRVKLVNVSVKKVGSINNIVVLNTYIARNIIWGL